MQLPEAEELVAKSRAKTIILLNAEWTDTKSVASRHGSFVASFETAYCFQPIAIQACPDPPPSQPSLLAHRSSLAKNIYDWMLISAFQTTTLTVSPRSCHKARHALQYM